MITTANSDIRKQVALVFFILFAFATKNLFAQTPIVRFDHITSDDGLPQNTVLGIVKDKYGFMWFGTWDGLCRYDGYSFKSYVYDPKDKNSINSNRIHTIKLDKDRNLWIRTFENDELCRYNYEHDNFERFSKGKINDTLFDWSDRRRHAESNKIAYGQFIWSIDVNNNRLVEKNSVSGRSTLYDTGSPNPGKLNDPYVTDIYKDNHNILWVGTYSNGINKANLNARPFTHFYHDPAFAKSLIDNNVMAICEDKAGNVWIGTRDKGITVMGSTIRHIQKGVGALSSDKIRSVFCDSGGIIWIGTKEGLNTYNPNTGAFADFSRDIDYKSVFGIIEDSNHDLVFATWNGIYKYNSRQKKIISYDSAALKLHPHTRVVFQDSKKRLWVGCEGEGGATGGISVLEPTKAGGYRLQYHFLHDLNRNSLSDNRINCIYEDKAGIIWIGTGNGLDTYNPHTKRFSNLSVSGKFPKSSVTAILEDNNGNLWISHKKGLSRLSKNDRGIRTYTLQDGLQSKEFFAGSAFKSPKAHKLYFGGNNGFNVFNPDNILPEKTLPNTVLTELEILNRRVGINEKVNGRVVLSKPLYLTKKIALKYGDKSISIEFAGLHYSNPVANKYAYKLEGFDKDWVYTDAGRRVATYSNLDAGEYTFKVVSSNSDGVWNTRPAVLKIEVMPPLWATAWAYLLYACLLIMALYTYHRYSIRVTRLKSKLAYDALIHNQEYELYQSKLQFFTNISHEIKTPLTLILAPLERLLEMFAGNKGVHAQLSTMKISGDRLLKLVNQLLDFRKLDTGNLDLDVQKHDIIAFLTHTLESFKDGAGAKSIHLSFVHDVGSCSFPYDEDMLEKVLYNLLSNALKFTPEYGWIKIRFSFSAAAAKQYAVIEVINPAAEIIPEEDREIIFLPFRQGKKNTTGGTGLGLAFSKGLIELHGGFIEVESAAVNDNEIETTFKIGLPLQPEVKIVSQEKGVSVKDTAVVPASPLQELEEPDTEFITPDKKELNTKHIVILLVEDNPDMRGYLKTYFSDFYTVLEASNGKEGFDMAVSQLPGLIISDVMMDEMDGFELCSSIKGDLRTSHIPVVLLTAQTPVESEIQGIENGADDYITKPFNLAILSARVSNLLESRKKLKEKYRKEISLRPNEDVPASADEILLTKLLAFIEENMANSALGVEEICTGVGVSRSQLYRKVKELTGLSLSEILKEVRLKKARQLLTDSKCTVNEIAYMVGFSDADYFRKCFKSEFGMAPTEYAKKAAN